MFFIFFKNYKMCFLILFVLENKNLVSKALSQGNEKKYSNIGPCFEIMIQLKKEYGRIKKDLK